MPQVITLYRCYKCDADTEWDFSLGAEPLCASCWDRQGDKSSLSGWAKKKRKKEIIRLYTTEGKSVEELVSIFGVSQRTVQRALKVEEVKV